MLSLNHGLHSLHIGMQAQLACPDGFGIVIPDAMMKSGNKSKACIFIKTMEYLLITSNGFCLPIDPRCYKYAAVIEI